MVKACSCQSKLESVLNSRLAGEAQGGKPAYCREEPAGPVGVACFVSWQELMAKG